MSAPRKRYGMPQLEPRPALRVRHGSVLPRSHKDSARKAFEKLTKKVLPGSLRAVAARAQRRSEDLPPARRRAGTPPAAAPRDPDAAAAVDVDELAEDDGEPQDLDDDAEQAAA